MDIGGIEGKQIGPANTLQTHLATIVCILNYLNIRTLRFTLWATICHIFGNETFTHLAANTRRGDVQKEPENYKKYDVYSSHSLPRL